MSDQDYAAALAHAQKERSDLLKKRDELDEQIKRVSGIVWALSNLLNVPVPDGLMADGTQRRRRKAKP